MFKHYRYRISPVYDSPEFRTFLNAIARGQADVGYFLKEDTTTTVWCSEYHSQPMVVKRYNTKNTWHAIRRAFRRSRADNCREMTEIFIRAGITSAPNIAVIQEWLGPFKGRSWFICEYIKGITLYDYFDSPGAGFRDPLEIDNIKSGISHIFSKLQDSMLSHGDFKASNILLSERGPCLIDLDAARSHRTKPSFQRAHDKDRARFLENWQEMPLIFEIFKLLQEKK